MRPGPADPAEPGVEDQQRQQAQPEDRHGIADQADDAHDLVDEAAALHRGEHAERNAEDERRSACPASPARASPETRAVMSCITGLVVSTERAEIAGQRSLHIDEELLPQRQVEAILLARRARRRFAGARSPTIASTGSIGMTRPMKKVTASSPRKVIAATTQETQHAPMAREEALRRLLPRFRCRARRSDNEPDSAGSLLCDRRHEVGVEGRPELEALDVLAQARDLGLLEDMMNGPCLADLLLQILVHLGALGGVTLEQRRLGLSCQSAGTSQALRQASVLSLESSALSGLTAKVSALEFGSQ